MTHIVRYFSRFVAFLVRIKNHISARFNAIVDMLLSALVTFLCRHYQGDCY